MPPISPSNRTNSSQYQSVPNNNLFSRKQSPPNNFKEVPNSPLATHQYPVRPVFDIPRVPATRPDCCSGILSLSWIEFNLGACGWYSWDVENRTHWVLVSSERRVWYFFEVVWRRLFPREEVVIWYTLILTGVSAIRRRYGWHSIQSSLENVKYYKMTCFKF